MIYAKLATLTIALTVLFTVSVFANSVGFSYTSGFGSNNVAVSGDYEKDFFAVEGMAQAGNGFDATVTPSVRGDMFGVGGKLYSKNTFKGASIDTAGRQNDIGVDFIIPVGRIGTEVSVGVFGRNGSPFATTYKLDDPADPNSAVATSRGITIKDDSSINAAIGAEFDVNRFKVGLKAIIELIGEGPRADMVALKAATSGELLGELDWNTALELEVQRYNGSTEYENGIFAGVSYKF